MFKGMPSFSPELFREVANTDPMKTKQLEKGLNQQQYDDDDAPRKLCVLWDGIHGLGADVLEIREVCDRRPPHQRQPPFRKLREDQRHHGAIDRRDQRQGLHHRRQLIEQFAQHQLTQVPFGELGLAVHDAVEHGSSGDAHART